MFSSNARVNVTPLPEILLFRPLGPGAELGRWFPGVLRESGFAVSELPLLEIAASEEIHTLPAVLEGLSPLDWIVFTSSNAVCIAFDVHPESFARTSCRYAVVGRKTANTLSTYGRNAVLIAKRESASGLAAELCETLVPDSAVVFLRGRTASNEIAAAVTAAGGRCVELIVYETRRRHLDEVGEQRLLRLLLRDTPDSLIPVFTNSESVRVFWELLSHVADPATLLPMLRRFRYAAIGPETRKSLEELGLQAVIVPPEPSLESLHAALVTHRDIR